jgi:hypothetical protein
MKARKKPPQATAAKPEKVLLHMARTDRDWAGVAIRFDGGEPYRFRSLKVLFAWLSSLRRGHDPNDERS